MSSYGMVTRYSPERGNGRNRTYIAEAKDLQSSDLTTLTIISSFCPCIRSGAYRDCSGTMRRLSFENYCQLLFLFSITLRMHVKTKHPRKRHYRGRLAHWRNGGGGGIRTRVQTVSSNFNERIQI